MKPRYIKIKNYIQNLWQQHRLFFVASCVFVVGAIAGVSLWALQGETPDTIGPIETSEPPASPPKEPQKETKTKKPPKPKVDKSETADSKPTEGTSPDVGREQTADALPYETLSPGTTWQWQLTGAVNETILDYSTNSKKMMDIDMEEASPALIQRLKDKGIVVICYMEVGAWESYRSDASDFPESVKGRALDPPYNDERYLDIRSNTVKNLILKRFDSAQQKGCDGVEPDIDDAYFEDFTGNYKKASTYTGFTITYNDQVDYNKFLSAAAHERDMSYGLKNGADQRFVYDLLPHIDWVLSEQCYEFSSCGAYTQVIDAGKAVFEVEYTPFQSAICTALNARNFDALFKDEELNALPRKACR